MKPFTPGAVTAKVTAATTSAEGKVADGVGIKQLRLHNAGTVTAFLAFGKDNTVDATLAAAMPLPSGAVEVISFQPDGNAIWLSAITASGTADIYVTPGQGI